MQKIVSMSKPEKSSCSERKILPAEDWLYIDRTHQPFKHAQKAA